MNKTEKLLAARKKLKEFQLHKSNHEQEVVPPNPPNHHQHEKVVELQENNVMADQIKYNNSDDSNADINGEELQIHSHSSISNNDINMENSKSIEPLINLNEQVAIIENQTNEYVRDIGENLETIPTNEKEIDFDIPSIQNETLPQETEIKIFETMKLPNFSNVVNDLKPLEMKTIENGADFFNSINVTQNSSHLISSEAIDSIVENKNTENSTNESHFEMRNDNKSLLSNLETENNTIIQQLQVQLTQSHNRISELENLLVQKNTEFNDALLHQVNPLKEQIQMHRQAAEVLVAEKADLSAALSQYQNVAQQKSKEVGEIYEKLKHTLVRLTDTERELLSIKMNAEDDKILNEKLSNNYTELEKQFKELNTVREEQQLETAELQQDLNIKKTELANIQKQLEENKNLLSLAELKIQQLTNVPQQLEQIDIQNDGQVSLKQQLSQLQENINSITNEKEEMCKHYESYVKQLNIKYEGTVQELELAEKTIHEFREREESLIQRLSLMEQHYQREKQKVDSLLPLQAYEEKINHLTKSMDSLVLEQENSQRALHEKEAEVEAMKEELQELRELRDQSVETSKLVTALEGEQLGASRAVSQNQQLKLQLNEMHDAFVMLSNSKLNLTEQLQDERMVGRKLNAEYSRIEADRDELKEELNRKAAIIDELEKDKLHFAQMADQMQHYQVQSTQARTLQQELENALNTIEILKNENKLLTKRINSSSEIIDEIHVENENCTEQSIENPQSINTAVENVIEEAKVCEEINQSQSNSYDTLADNQKKLELRFKETMERVAELTDEKQRLEHLVLQLQSETETIGEYITLYQKQRSILQMKAQEKERTFNQLIDERNRLQAQLHQLKILVAQLLKVEDNSSNSVATSHQNILPETLQHNEHPPDAVEVVDGKGEEEKPEGPTITDIKNETTTKILDLLTEIKDCKDTCSVEPNFHHCLWCSGKLITV